MSQLHAAACFMGLLLLLAATDPATARSEFDAVPNRDIEVLARLPRDRSLFTQGLLIRDGLLYHSGGLYGRSRLVVADIDSGQARLQRQLPASWFAEGIAILGDELFLLTWKEGIAAVFDIDSLQPLRQLKFQGEGWGLTSDGQQLIMSNGSAEISWRDPVDFAIQRRLTVRAGKVAVTALNELEWADSILYANILFSDYLVAINPETGQLEYKADLSGLLDGRERRRAGVLNGIAFDAASGELYVSGKNWPWLFRVRLRLPGQ